MLAECDTRSRNNSSSYSSASDVLDIVKYEFVMFADDSPSSVLDLCADEFEQVGIEVGEAINPVQSTTIHNEVAVGLAQLIQVPSERRGLAPKGVLSPRALVLQSLQYECGYCGRRKQSTSRGAAPNVTMRVIMSVTAVVMLTCVYACAGADGRVRHRCECGGKHADSKARMHANWKMCMDSASINLVGHGAVSVSDMVTNPYGGESWQALMLQFLQYECGYCNVRKISTSTGDCPFP